MKFTKKVTAFVGEVLGRWRAVQAEKPGCEGLDLDSLAVHSEYPLSSGRVPVWCENRNWIWKPFHREADAVLGRFATVGGDSPGLLPPVAIENKVDGRLNTDIIDAKDTIYGRPQRAVSLPSDTAFLRNGRHFDLVLTSWGEQEQELLSRSIIVRLDYAVACWKR